MIKDGGISREEREEGRQQKKGGVTKEKSWMRGD